MVGVLGEDSRPYGRIKLFPIDAEAGQVGRDQHASQGRGTPTATRCGWDAVSVQLSTQRREGLTSQDPARHLVDDGGFIRLDGAEVDSVAVASWAAVRSATLGQFLLLAADPPRGPLDIERTQGIAAGERVP